MKASEKKYWAHLATLRLSEGTNCFAVSMYDLCASPLFRTSFFIAGALGSRANEFAESLTLPSRKLTPCNRFHVLSVRGTRESPTLARCILFSLRVVALWAVARACLLGKHWNGACCSDNSARHICIETLQSKVPLRKPTLSGSASSLSYSDAMQISQQKTSFILLDWSAKIKDSLDNKILSVFHIGCES